MRQRALFAGVKCFVCADGLSPSKLLSLECALRDGGATLLDQPVSGDSTHIVCVPEAYAMFGAQRDGRFVSIVRPEWVFRSLLLQFVLPEDRFSADPALFFSALAVAAGPIEKDPRKVIDGLIAHFGGQIIDQQEVYAGATHILSPDTSPAAIAVPPERLQLLNVTYSDADVARAVETWRLSLAGQSEGSVPTFELPSCLVAFMGKQAGLSAQFHVSYSWIEECVRRKTRVPEGAFAVAAVATTTSKPASWKARPVLELEDLNLHKCAVVYQLARTEHSMELSMLRRSTERLAEMQTALSGAIVLLAQHIPPVIKESLLNLLRSAKAKVANVPLGDSYQDIVRKVVANASFVVCCYTAGFEYEEAVRQHKRVVSIFWVLDGGHFTMESSDQTPFSEAIERPMSSHGGIPGMRSFVITLSGYTSRTQPTRDQVQIAISATGACMLPVLSRTHSTHLLCYEPAGEKFKKAKSWRFENILSHKWLFDSLAAWEYLPEDKYRYVSLGKPAAKAVSEPAAAKETDKTVDPADSDGTRGSATSSTATTPADGRRGSAKSNRFDVDALLTELDHNTPQDKKSGTTAANADAKVDSAEPAASGVACLLFDTPSKTMSPRKTRGGRNEDASRKEPKPEEVVKTKETKTDAASKSKQPRGSTGSKKRNSKGSDASLEGEPESSSLDKVAKKTASSSKTASAIATGRKRKASSLSVSTDKAETTTPSIETSNENAQPKKKATKRAATSLASTPSASAPTTTSAGRKGSDFVFLLTGSREEMAVNESIVMGLGGKVSTVERRFDGDCTHVICSELKRTEKFVAGCASGKWILKPSYLEASSEAGRFVDEEAHEWGTTPQDKALMDERIWPCAPSFWRTARAAGKPGAFAGWRVLVHAKCHPPAAMCERIVAAGDGQVVPMTKATDLAKLAAEASEEKPVVALVPGDLPARDTWLKKLKASKVECINASFLIDVLTKEQAPPVARAQYRV